jgi:HEAT repeat protein
MLSKKGRPEPSQIEQLDQLAAAAHLQSVSMTIALMKTVPLGVMQKAARIPKKADSLYALADAATDPDLRSQFRKYGQALEQSKLVRAESERRTAGRPGALLGIGYASEVARLAAAVKDPNPKVALNAVKKLARMGSKDVEAHLAEAVMHNSTQVRSAAIDALIERKKI